MSLSLYTSEIVRDGWKSFRDVCFKNLQELFPSQIHVFLMRFFSNVSKKKHARSNAAFYRENGNLNTKSPLNVL